jgi:hypothetical protein
MTNELLFHERLSSPRTSGFLAALALLSGLLGAGRMQAAGVDAWAVAGLGFSAFFWFYVLNYRSLDIRLTAAALTLTFGVFHWVVPLDNVDTVRLDQLPWLLWYGGAGIHFMTAHRRYRVSLNFLEHPRVVIGLKRKAGLVRDVSFSTRRPGEVIRCLQAAIATLPTE